MNWMKRFISCQRTGFHLLFCLGLLLTSSAHAADLASEAPAADAFTIQKGFQIERIYSVPKEDQGSWVSLTVDEFGRLITSDQNGKLYRITPPAVSGSEIKIEPIPVELGFAQGLLCAFDSLYVMVNGRGVGGNGAGLYRVQDTDGDDMYDQVTLLRKINGGGEHGPHAIVLSPDKQSLMICGGNHTDIPQPETSRVPRNWQEDQLLPRMWDARGHAAGKLAPGGWVAKTDPEGKSFELFCSGFRNEYDIAFNTEGELFTYDADMEWDVGTPWYRPTRVNHCTSGAEFGWRSGTGKWPEYYPDSLGSTIDIGPGSPTGIAFGTGAKFPHQYQRALFISDWSYGVIYAVHLTPDGASYVGEKESFVTAAPLPVTDIVINPIDRAMYFTIGGRGTQSGLYRVTYVGDEPTTPAMPQTAGAEARNIRRELESLHQPLTGDAAAEAVEQAWPHLAHDDRHIRFAARIAIEHQPPSLWQSKALAAIDPMTKIQATIALARCAEPTEQTLEAAIQSLTAIDWKSLSDDRQADLMRAISLCLIRMVPENSEPPAELRDSLVKYLDGHYPAENFKLNRELSSLLSYLAAPGTPARTLALMQSAPTQEEAIHYAYTLRPLKSGWSKDERQAYFNWFTSVGGTRGGASFGGFLKNIREEAAKLLSDAEKEQLGDLVSADLGSEEVVAVSRTQLVKEWTVEDLLADAQNGMQGRNFEKGREYFAEAGCYKCHRMAGDGGITGPDLTAAGNRFDHRAMLESIIEPSKVVSDQYQASQFVLSDGRVVTGRVVNMGGNNISVMTNMLDPGNHTGVNRDLIEQVLPAQVSLMPSGLLNTFTKEEILDLLAYIRSGGKRESALFVGK